MNSWLDDLIPWRKREIERKEKLKKHLIINRRKRRRISRHHTPLFIRRRLI